MIDREADGSDSLEVGLRATPRHASRKLMVPGLHDASFNSRRYRVWSWFVSS